MSMKGEYTMQPRLWQMVKQSLRHVARQSFRQLVRQWMVLLVLLCPPLAWADATPVSVVPAANSEVVIDTVNVNTANAEEISEGLAGIGLSKAQAIVAYREKNGPFVALEELTAVKGVGEKTLAKNAARIRLQ
ncbi:ComEA family DNA-binding protein [Aestuariirhabdus sp. LZHN29]|uniref:ComEA family DNA-binding protein n=1 Tax=Aestuariirhabdus sp. LZHN29 TaxID=3417462 RepID=UPI003CFAE06C